MTCAELVELVTAFLEGALDSETEQRFVEHLAICDGCETYLEQIRQTIAGLRTLARGEDFPRTREQALAAFRELRAEPAG